MKSFLDKIFKRGFFLSEEHLIKIHDIVTKRLKEKGYPNNLNYKVYRSDSLVFETTEYNKVLEEENSKRNKVNKIEILHDCESLKFKLLFGQKENVQLQIESEEKDFTYLLFSDLKEYLSTEVLKFRSFNFNDLRVDRYLFPVIMMIMLTVSITFINKTSLPKKELDVLLKSNSIEDKLNFLITNTQRNINISNFLYLMFGIIIIFILTFPLLIILDRLYPRNVFYFGKTISFYDKVCSIRSKIIWGIVIALVIGVISGLLVFRMTS